MPHADPFTSAPSPATPSPATLTLAPGVAPAATPALVLCELADTGLPHMESYSPFCLKVHRALKVAGLSYQRRMGAHPGVFRALNPAAQVPVLLVDDRPVSDSTEIVREILRLKPDAMWSSAQAWLLEELADTSLNGFLVAARWADDDNWTRTRAAYFGDMPALPRMVIPAQLRRGVIKNLVARDVWRAGPEACWRRFELLLDSLNKRAPANGFWLGDGLSVGDVALFAQLWALCTPLTPRQGDSVRARPRLYAWLERVNAATSATLRADASSRLVA